MQNNTGATGLICVLTIQHFQRQHLRKVTALEQGETILDLYGWTIYERMDAFKSELQYTDESNHELLKNRFRQKWPGINLCWDLVKL